MTDKPEETKITESRDGTIHVVPPKGHRGGVTVLLDSDDLVREQVGGFINFLRERAVVGLAIGFIIGQQAQGFIKQLVDSFITPILNIIVGSKLQNRVFHLGSEPFAWGKFVYVFVNFLFIVLAIYLIVRAFHLDTLDASKKVKAKKS